MGDNKLRVDGGHVIKVREVLVPAVARGGRVGAERAGACSWWDELFFKYVG
jgi:hypothetical protein